jgi:exopolysaccharide biosynthesis polyprenyl glycosylphosphotransferase
MTADLGGTPLPPASRVPLRHLHGLGAWTPAAAWHVDTVPPPRGRSSRIVGWVAGGVLLGADLVAFAAATLLTKTVSVKSLFVLALVLGFFYVADLYRPRLTLSILDDAPAILGRSLAAGAGAMVLGGLNDGVAGIARIQTALAFGGLCLVTREIAYIGMRSARGHDRLRRRTLLLGGGTMAGELATNLLAHPHYGLEPVGLLDDDPLLCDADRPVPLLGGYDDLAAVLVQQAVDVVIVTYGSVREPSMVTLLRACDRLSCEIYFVPRLYELHSVTRDTELLWGFPLVRMRRAPFRAGGWSVKRLFDIGVSAIALLLLAPVLLTCALLSRLDTGCVLFRQPRVGLDGRTFTLLKFCTLHPTDEGEPITRWNIADDPRLHRIGRFLRRSSLDELPQLFNVLRGDMSLVGPRPERPFFVDEFSRQFPWYQARHRVPAGLTGLAQVHGLRGDTSIGERARFDNVYIENWSLWGDIKIMIRTVRHLLSGGGR